MSNGSHNKLKKTIGLISPLLKVILGFVFIFLIHLPKKVYLFLLLSYYKVFPNKQNLTANPKEHLLRARKLLNKKNNSLLLYAALELRFALERMLDQQIIFAEDVTNKMLKQYNPSKKRKNMSLLDNNVNYPHKIIFKNKETGETFEWGKYNPISQRRVNQIHGKLGDLLHPKRGINLGIANDPWYQETYNFLYESLKYLNDINNNLNYFSYKGIEQFELVRIDDE